MRCCQLCGATSWGPIVAAQEVLAGMREFADAQAINPLEYYRCDHCKSIAMKRFVDEPQAPAMGGGSRMSGGLVDPMAAMLAAIPQLLPLPALPETRTERLTRSLLTGGCADDAQQVVGFVRELERAMDAPRSPEFGPDRIDMDMEHFKRLLQEALRLSGFTWDGSVSALCDRLVQQMEHDFNE